MQPDKTAGNLIRWGLQEITVYTPDEAIYEINNTLGRGWTKKDLYKYAELERINVLCYVRKVPIVITHWKHLHFQDDAFSNAWSGDCRFIKEIECWSGYCAAPPENIEALARNRELPVLTEIEYLDSQKGTDCCHPVANLEWYAKTYHPVLNETGLNFKVNIEVTIHFLNEIFDRFDTEYEGGSSIGYVETVEDDYWIDGDSLDLYIYRCKNSGAGGKSLVAEYVDQAKNIELSKKMTEFNDQQPSDKAEETRPKSGRKPKFSKEDFDGWYEEWLETRRSKTLADYFRGKTNLSLRQCQRHAIKYDTNNANAT